MNKAIFLDRDGVINREIGNYITSADNFEMNPGVTKALKALKQKGYILIVATNQGGIAKGLYTHEILADIHAKMNKALAAEDVYLDDIYYCPHHPEFTQCLCRKPGSLMLEKAMAKHRIQAHASYFIGDNDRDIVAGQAAGVQTIKTESNQALDTILHLVK